MLNLLAGIVIGIVAMLALASALAWIDGPKPRRVRWLMSRLEDGSRRLGIWVDVNEGANPHEVMREVAEAFEAFGGFDRTEIRSVRDWEDVDPTDELRGQKSR